MTHFTKQPLLIRFLARGIRCDPIVEEEKSGILASSISNAGGLKMAIFDWDLIVEHTETRLRILAKMRYMQIEHEQSLKNLRMIIGLL